MTGMYGNFEKVTSIVTSLTVEIKTLCKIAFSGQIDLNHQIGRVFSLFCIQRLIQVESDPTVSLIL